MSSDRFSNGNGSAVDAAAAIALVDTILAATENDLRIIDREIENLGERIDRMRKVRAAIAVVLGGEVEQTKATAPHEWGQ